MSLVKLKIFREGARYDCANNTFCDHRILQKSSASLGYEEMKKDSTGCAWKGVIALGAGLSSLLRLGSLSLCGEWLAEVIQPHIPKFAHERVSRMEK
jgi:hypothetical protein